MATEDDVVKLYEAARDNVYRYLLVLGMRPAEAQETTQEVFLRLHMALSRGQTIENLRAWAFRVAHNLGLKVILRNARRDSRTDRIESDLPDFRANAEQAFLTKERNAQIASALDTLSPQQRQCLFLRAEGMKYREIAETLGISTSTVNEFLSRALMRLKRAGHG